MRASKFPVALMAALGAAWAANVAAQDPPAAEPTFVDSTEGRLRVDTLATLQFPWGMALLPDGRILITEKPGRLRIFADGRLSEPIEGVPDVVYRGARDQGGLLDVAIHPEFADNGYVYLSFVEAADERPTARKTPTTSASPRSISRTTSCAAGRSHAAVCKTTSSRASTSSGARSRRR
jgi:glucose/arabinose dehydrogenase